MHATIRRYTSKDPSKAKAAFTSLKGRIESKFVPTLHDVPGFHGYYVLNANDRELVTISIFESRAGAEESTRRAAEFIRGDPMKDQLGPPEIIEGDLLIAKEAAVGTH